MNKKLLSRDESNSAETLLARLTVGFSGALKLDPTLTWEWVMIDGDMVLADDTVFARLGYSHRPAGNEETTIAASKKGCVMLMWSDPATLAP